MNKEKPAYDSIALTNESQLLSNWQKIGGTSAAVAILAIILSFTGLGAMQPEILFWVITVFFAVSAYAYSRPNFKGSAGIKNNGIMFKSLTAQGSIAWIIGIVLTGFYIVLYWYSEWLQGLIAVFNPFSYLLRGKPADQWFMYGFFYTIAVLYMGFRYIGKYRNNRYQIIRTFSVMFFQLGFAFLIPAFLIKLNQPEFYFSYFWPLKYSYLFPSDVNWLTDAGNIGIFMVSWGAIMTFIATPILSYKYGKRWYCSWVCGCGGLAETAGDPFRQLSSKKLSAWKIERWLIHSVLVFVTVTTGLLWINAYQGGAILGSLSHGFAQWYGFFIGAIFSGVIGVGFYPIMGSRVWCRFGCPMAAVLGMFQRFKSKFRITTNGGQCISCGNCSTYCEMGIDVRWYAQRGQNIVRSSCVGCGVCSAVCPRGVLNLENKEEKGRINDQPILIGNNSIKVQE